MRYRTWSLPILAILACAACGEEAPAEGHGSEETPPVEEDIAEDEVLPEPTRGQQQMHDRYEGVEAVRDAIVRGDLDEARSSASGLERPVSAADLPASANVLRDVVPERARALANANSAEAVASAFADLVRGCGQCHAAANVEWRFVDHPAPDGEELPGHMRRHEWAVVRMWEALLIADEERFDLGARALEESPITGDEPLEAEDENPPGLSQIATQLHRRARDVRDATDMQERAVIYGDLLSRCATCHSRIAQLDAEGEESR